MFFVTIIQEKSEKTNVWTYTLQSLQGKLLGFQVLIALIKISMFSIFLKLLGKIFQIFGFLHFFCHDIQCLLRAF